MAYIGAQPRLGNFQACDAISVVNGQAAYTLQVGGANISPQSAQHCLVSLNGVLQAPISSYTIVGSTIVFAAALTTSDAIDFVTILGDTLNLGVPSDDTVGAAQIKADLISGTTALTAEPADTDEFLVSDAGTLKRIDYSLIKGGGITVADQWRLTANLTATNGTISSNLEQVDTAPQGTLGSAMTVSSGIFTFPSTGFYLVGFHGYGANSSSADNMTVIIKGTTNNSSYVSIAETSDSAGGAAQDQIASFSTQSIVDVTNTTNVKVLFETSSFASGSYLAGSTDTNYSAFHFIRLGDT